MQVVRNRRHRHIVLPCSKHDLPRDARSIGSADFVDYSTSAGAAIVNLASNTATGGEANGDIISNFEEVVGGAGDDRPSGTPGEAYLEGGVATTS